jgi:hypothetical protein
VLSGKADWVLWDCFVYNACILHEVFSALAQVGARHPVRGPKRPSGPPALPGQSHSAKWLKGDEFPRYTGTSSPPFRPGADHSVGGDVARRR